MRMVFLAMAYFEKLRDATNLNFITTDHIPYLVALIPFLASLWNSRSAAERFQCELRPNFHNSSRVEVGCTYILARTGY